MQSAAGFRLVQLGLIEANLTIPGNNQEALITAVADQQVLRFDAGGRGGLEPCQRVFAVRPV